MALSDFERGIVAGKLTASRAIIESYDRVIAAAQAERQRFVDSAESFKRLLDEDDATRQRVRSLPTDQLPSTD